MSTYDDASLVMIPSGYKTGTVFSQKPMSTDGQLTFTRSNDTATRVASNGLIEKVRTNLILYSQEFDNAYWVKSSGGVASAPVVTANAELAPDGTMTADRIVFNLNGGILVTDFSLLNSAGFTTAAQENTTSIFLKTTDGTTKTIQITAPDGTGLLATVTGTYQRFTITSIGAAAASALRIRLRGTVGTSDSASLAVWGAQFESGVETDYIPTTTAAVSVGPVANVPRIDYTGGGCGKLLLEPQRTNLQLFSEQFDNAGWSKSAATVTANTSVAPDGSVSADKLNEDATIANHFVNRNVPNSNSLFSFSVFAKKSERNFLYLQAFATVPNNFTYVPSAYFNLNTGTVGTVSGATAMMQDYGNGWYRCTLMCSSIFSQLSANIGMYIMSAIANGTNSFQGVSGSGILIWGAQAEAAAYATSYIPTLAASVTRGADACSKTGISSLIGQSEGTIFLQFNNRLLASYLNEYIVQIISGTTQLWVRKESGDNTYTIRLIVSGVTIWTFASVSIPNGNVKLAASYKTGDSAIYLNGAQVSTTNTAAFSGSAFSDLNFNFGGTLNPELPLDQALLFKTRLPNSELASLTTL